MSSPTQVLPSWLTLSDTVVTQPDGSLSTSSVLLHLPLTYYGPSIPLGTDGSWTYGGLTPPPPTMSPTTLPSSLSAASSSPSSLPLTSSLSSTSVSSLVTSSPSPPSISSSSTSSLPPSFSSTPLPSPSVAPVTASNHGIKPSILGGILGGVLGAIFLVILILILCLLRRYHSRNSRKRTNDASHSSSSFWNRSTTIFSRKGSRRQTPIWTGWEMVDPEDPHQNGGTEDRMPGEGSPRDSGEEGDPFLTRRSVRSGTNEMTQTKTGTDTLVSVPAAAAVAGGSTSTHRSGSKVGGPIMPRSELLIRMNEDQGTPSVRIVESSPQEYTSALLPPPPISPDRRSILGARPSDRSLASQNTKTTSQGRSLASEKSLGSLADPQEQEQESAELLTARRVKVGELGQTKPAPLPSAIQPDAGPSLSVGNVLGLDRLANLGRLSWFKRMSFLGSRDGTRADLDVADPYTRTPPRSHSRQGSRSRPVSWAPLPTHDPSGEPSMSRRPRPQSNLASPQGLGFGGERPISSLSAKSRASVASGTTVYHDARSTPGSLVVDVPSVGTIGSSNTSVPPVPPLPQQAQRQISPSRGDALPVTTSGGYLSIPGEPPSYDDAQDSPSTEVLPSEVDVLDIPAPRPASPFTAASSRPDFPPGLVPLPNPHAWRDSHASSFPRPSSSVSSSGIQIDILEEEPPAAQDGWRSLSAIGERRAAEGRRTTFGVPMVVHQRDGTHSEQGSLHSMRSHLSPRSNLSPSGSAPASSLHTHGSSGSMRPSTHSQGRTASSGISLTHSGSISEDDRRHRRRGEVSEVGSPPLSAVFNGRERVTDARPISLLAHNPRLPATDSIEGSPASASNMALFASPATVSGTITSSGTGRTTGTDDSNTNSSVTTALTDPITGTVMHFPALPWRRGQDTAWGDRRHDDNSMW